MTRDEAIDYVNDASNFKERQRRKARVFHILYGNPNPNEIGKTLNMGQHAKIELTSAIIDKIDGAVNQVLPRAGKGSIRDYGLRYSGSGNWEAKQPELETLLEMSLPIYTCEVFIVYDDERFSRMTIKVKHLEI